METCSGSSTEGVHIPREKNQQIIAQVQMCIGMYKYSIGVY